FFGCSAFNQPIGSWNISAVTNVDNMLSGCAAFNQNLSGWTFSAGTSHNNYDTSATVWQSDYKPHFAEYKKKKRVRLCSSLPLPGGEGGLRRSHVDSDCFDQIGSILV